MACTYTTKAGATLSIQNVDRAVGLPENDKRKQNILEEYRLKTALYDQLVTTQTKCIALLLYPGLRPAVRDVLHQHTGGVTSMETKTKNITQHSFGTRWSPVKDEIGHHNNFMPVVSSIAVQ